MAGTTIGTAYVQIIPSAEGIKGKLTEALGGEVTNAGKGLGGKLASGLKTGLKATAVAAGAAIAAVGTAAVAAGKQALDSYKDYEQLVGGVETLFGNGGKTLSQYQQASGKSVQEATKEYYNQYKAQEEVLANAANAYKTAGMSQNEYMETVTGFSAALIQSLGGDTRKAASYADMAITDMSDNANKMGTDIGSIQNAYQGFAKQNYTMLDNLKLGYGGTKEEMDRLIRDAEKMDDSFSVTHKKTKKGADEISYSYADIVDAIHIVQTNMGITGTTAEEAGSTIQGSISAASAAWSNLLTGMADDNADIGSLIDNFIESALTAADNILPRVGAIMEGMATLITTALPQILPVIVQIITDNLPMIIEAGFQILIALITGLITAIPQLVAALPQIWETIKSTFAANLPAMKEAGMQLLTMLVEGVQNALASAKEAVNNKLAEWGAAADAAMAEFGEAIHTGLSAFVSEVGNWINDNIIQPAKDAVAKAVDVGKEVVEKIKQGINDAWSGLTSWFDNLWSNLFGNRNVNVNVNAGGNVGGAGGYAKGLDYVPYDEFPAILHKGEAVLTAEEAAVWRNGGGGGMTINQYIQTVPQSPVQLASATAASFELARWAV